VKRGGKITVAVLVAAGGVGIYLWMSRDRTGLAIIGSSGPFITYSRSEVGEKPVIDLTLPGGRRIIYPRHDDQPQDKKFINEVPHAAGVIRSSGRLVTPWIFPRWNIERQIVQAKQAGPGSAVAATPYVFGSKSLIAKLDAGEDGTVSVRLPGNGRPAPVLPTASGKIESWTVKLTPRPVVTPIQPLMYDVTVAGAGPNDQFAIDFKWGSYQSYYLLVGKKPGLLRLMSWAPRTTFKVRIRRLTESSITLSVREATESGMRLKKLLGPDGTKLVVIDSAAQFQGSAFYGNSAIIVGEGKYSAGNPLAPVVWLGANSPLFFDLGAEFLRPLINGDTATATEYRFGEPHEGSLTLELPSPNEFLVPPLNGFGMSAEDAFRVWAK
jgi:hypothetical protein